MPAVSKDYKEKGNEREKVELSLCFINANQHESMHLTNLEYDHSKKLEISECISKIKRNFRQ